MAEYVAKEKVLDEIDEWIEDGNENNLALLYARKYINLLTPADVRPVVHGRWTLNKDGSGTCSECGHKQYNCYDVDNWDNFCHFCGADMRPRSEKET